MHADINGWQMLSGRIKKKTAEPEIIDDISGERIGLEEIASGTRILNCNHINSLIKELHLQRNTALKLINAIITARHSCHTPNDLDELYRLSCSIARNGFNKIPCCPLSILCHLDPLHETISSFIEKVAIEKWEDDVPPSSCALTITSPRIAESLNLPPKSIIIVDGSRPAAPDELAIYHYGSRNFGLGKTAILSKLRIKWTAPVLQIRIRG